jgi:hypothetical protein
MRFEIIGIPSLAHLIVEIITELLLTPLSISSFSIRIERCTNLDVVSISTPETRLCTMADSIRCANIKVTGSGTTLPNATVKFPGAYTATDPYT